MSPARELLAFVATLTLLVVGVLHASILGGKVLSPADVVLVEASFREVAGASGFEPENRLLMDPVLQFEPWFEECRAQLRRGRLPLWNTRAGCGAPLVANGQAAVFDPTHLVAALGEWPGALAGIAAARLGLAGLGMFLLARAWGLGPWGRWFSGLAFPLCGFLMAWLLFPSAGVAAWLPWLFLATDRVLARPGGRALAGLAIAVGGSFLAGQVQVAAHGMLALSAFVAWRLWRREGKGIWIWGLGVALGIALAAVAIVPLAGYLALSPVWTDRAVEKVSAWALERPRLLESVCTAWPYAFGGQSRGLPNLARGLGVQNLNESAGGFAGLATLIWLAPLGWQGRRDVPVAGFLGVLIGVGALGAFAIPPVANLLRALPVLEVTDNRRLVLWVAFGLVVLGGIGLDRLAARAITGRGWRIWVGAWSVGAVLLLIASAGWWTLAGPKLRARALDHFRKTAVETPGADPERYRQRAEDQARRARAFVPLYYGAQAAQLLALAALATALRRGRIAPKAVRAGVAGIALADLLAFGVGLNPAIDPKQFRPESEAIRHLQRVAAPPFRCLAVGAELPPNLLMRYGLSDVRNYDSIELADSLSWFAPLYEPERGRVERTSRRTITWAGVLRAQDRLAAARVSAVVGASPPPVGTFAVVEKVGAVWIARLDADPGLPRRVVSDNPSKIVVTVEATWPGGRLVVDETHAPGWTASVDGRPAAVGADRGVWLSLEVPRGARLVTLRYDPIEVRVGGGVSLTALGLVVLLAAVGKKGREAGLDPSGGSG